LLYRANRLGNWSCALKSAISDIEVDYIDLEGRTFLEVKTHKGNSKDPKGRYEFGVLTSFSYPIDGLDNEFLTVATTRLETMLGDTAVAVHPEDPRYQHLHGKFVVHPFSGRKIPIITDSTLVDMTFGTGAVKITPAHDPNDYECGKRHNLEFITVLNPDGSINHHGGEEFEGLMRYDARVAMEDALDKKVRWFIWVALGCVALGWVGLARWWRFLLELVRPVGQYLLFLCILTPNIALVVFFHYYRVF
jgi:valyl-tRNA synthetase